MFVSSLSPPSGRKALHNTLIWCPLRRMVARSNDCTAVRSSSNAEEDPPRAEDSQFDTVRVAVRLNDGPTLTSRRKLDKNSTILAVAISGYKSLRCRS